MIRKGRYEPGRCVECIDDLMSVWTTSAFVSRCHSSNDDDFPVNYWLKFKADKKDLDEKGIPKIKPVFARWKMPKEIKWPFMCNTCAGSDHSLSFVIA